MLYEQLLNQRQVRLPDGLPVVLPVVLYTGLKHWNAPQELLSLIQPAPPRLASYQPQQRYLLIDQGFWAKKKALPHNNLTALLFLLEHSDDYDQARHLLRQLDQQSAQYRELRRAILSWLSHVFFPRVAPDLPTHDYYSFHEVHQMTEIDPRRWGYKDRMEGLAQGREEGIKEGREEGLEQGLQRAQLTILSRLIETKFGPLPADLQERIQTATHEQREAWMLQLLKAESLQELFH